MNPVKKRPSFNKTEQILAGCRKLAAEQGPGQTFNSSEIAEACGVHRHLIELTERRALRRFVLGMRSKFPGVFADIMLGRDLDRLLRRLAGRSGDQILPPARRGKIVKKCSSPISPPVPKPDLSDERVRPLKDLTHGRPGGVRVGSAPTPAYEDKQP